MFDSMTPSGKKHSLHEINIIMVSRYQSFSALRDFREYLKEESDGVMLSTVQDIKDIIDEDYKNIAHVIHEYVERKDRLPNHIKTSAVDFIQKQVKLFQDIMTHFTSHDDVDVNDPDVKELVEFHNIHSTMMNHLVSRIDA